MLADTLSFILCLALPLAAVSSEHGGLTRFFGAAVLLDFTVDALYSLVAEFSEDALWFESAFGAALYGAFLLFLLFAGKSRNMDVLQGAFRSVPKWTWGVLFFFEFTCYYRSFGEALSWYRVFAVISVVAVLAALFYLILRILLFSERQTQILRQLEEQREYGERLQHSDEELRSFRHDYKNHLIVIRSYLENGDTDAARSYFDSIDTISPEALRQISTGNFAADALINYKLHDALQHGVTISFHGYIPNAGLRNEDLCTILSNLLDNAVEAATPLPGDKEVHIETVSKNGFFLLCVTNPTAAGIAPVPDDLPKTSKPDRKNHGFGLKNVKRTAKKYGGSLTLESAGNVFTASVRLQL